jgi:mannosyltransferase
VIGVAALLRFATLDVQSFEHDEAVTAGRVLQASLWDTVSVLPESERTPPLYYVLGWAWSQVFGTGEVGLRALSALIGVLTVPVLYAAGRRLVSQRAGLAAAVLAAINPLLIWNSQDARAYSLGVLLTALALLAFAMSWDRPTSRSYAGFAAASALAAATHYFTLFVTVPMAAWLIWQRPRDRRSWAAAALLGLTALALAPLAYEQAESKGGDADFGQGGLVRRAAVTFVGFAAGVNPTIPEPDGIELLWRGGAVLVVVLFGLAVILALRSQTAGVRRGAIMMLTLAAAGIGLPLLLAVVAGDFYNGRNAMFALVPLLIVVGAGLVHATGRSRLAASVAFITISAIQLGAVALSNVEPGLQRPDWRNLADAVGSIEPDTALSAPETGNDPLALYLGAPAMPAEGVPVRRFIVVTVDDDPGAPPPAVEAPPDGFRPVESDEFEAFNLVVLEAERAHLMTSQQWREFAPAESAIFVGDDGG